MTRVKICGIKDVETALAALEAGTDYLGLVFARSKRQVVPYEALRIANAVHQRKPEMQVVGVFVNSPPAEVNAIAEYCRLDWVQLSGEETWEYCLEIQHPIIKAIHVSAQSKNSDIMAEVDQGYHLFREKLLCLLDTQVEGFYGGTGQTFSWSLAKEVSAAYPVIIAGGLTTENVVRMIQEINPRAVDVSSGIETGDKKDILKIRSFIRLAKSVTGSK